MAAFNDFSARFLETIDAMEVSDYKVWNTLESLSKETMSKIRRGVCGVSMNTLSDFVMLFDNVNANYILTGRGPMFLTPDLLQNESEQSIDALERMSNELERLRKENERLKQQLKKKESA